MAVDAGGVGCLGGVRVVTGLMVEAGDLGWVVYIGGVGWHGDVSFG